MGGRGLELCVWSDYIFSLHMNCTRQINCVDWHISYWLPIWSSWSISLQFASLYHWNFLLQFPCVMHLLHVAQESTSFGTSSIPDRKHWSRAPWFSRPTVTLDPVCLVCWFQAIEQSGICTQCHGRQHSLPLTPWVTVTLSGEYSTSVFITVGEIS